MNPQWMKRLNQPSRVASILDWKKTYTLLAVNFHKNRVGIAIASHPSIGVPCLELEPLRFDTDSKSIAGAINKDCLERFSTIVEEHQVCGVVVNWPLQRDTGRMGAACGRVVFALEQLWARSNESSSSSSTVTAAGTSTNVRTNSLRRNNNHRNSEEQGIGILSRPFCLWDAGRIDIADPVKQVDSFGRCTSHGKEKQLSNDTDSLSTSKPPLSEKIQPVLHRGYKNKNNNNTASTSITRTSSTDQYFHDEKNYFAGSEQYYEDEQTVVLGVWEDFCREHWPDLCTSTIETTNEESITTTHPQSLYRNLETDPPTRIQRKIMVKKKKSLVSMR